MSRIGKKTIALPEGVNINETKGVCEVVGTKGKLEFVIPEGVTVNINNGQIKITTSTEKTNLQGVTRAIISNMIRGVSLGWEKVLEINGTGFRAATTGSELNLSLGFSHPVKISAPKGITFEVKENKIKVMGTDKVQVGEIAAQIRKLKPADVYKHKGLKYEGEKLIKKAGKAAKAGAPGGK